MIDNKILQQILAGAGCFIQDIVFSAVVQALQQGTSLTPPKPETVSEEELIDTKEVCRIIGITRVTCDNWRKTNKLPYKRIGSRIRFDKQEVLAALQNFNRRAR